MKIKDEPWFVTTVKKIIFCKCFKVFSHEIFFAKCIVKKYEALLIVMVSFNLTRDLLKVTNICTEGPFILLGDIMGQVHV